MKKFFRAIAIISALALTSGCASVPKATTSETPNNSAKAASDDHASHHQEAEPATIKLNIPAAISTKKPINLSLELRDKDGKPISEFEPFQEKLMHLIVVSNDLQNFSHLHPFYRGNGRFEAVATFPKPGNYTLFSDYKPAGKSEQVSVVKIQVPGQASASSIDLKRTQIIDSTKITLDFSEPNVKAGKEVTVKFNLQPANSNSPINDLQPYLGEKGHLVILKQSPNLTASDYIHAHAIKQSQPGEISFATQFPQAGKYKLWMQFKRSNKIMTADFWVNVSQG